MGNNGKAEEGTEVQNSTRSAESPKPDQDSSSAGDSVTLSHGERGTEVFVVTEIFLPVTIEKVSNRAGVRTLAVFSNVSEANDYAQAHVGRLERLTRYKKAPEIGDDNVFRSTLKGIPMPIAGLDERLEWEVTWRHTTLVSVEKQTVYDTAGSAPRSWPMSSSTVEDLQGLGTGYGDGEEDEEEDDKTVVKSENRSGYEDDGKTVR